MSASAAASPAAARSASVSTAIVTRSSRAREQGAASTEPPEQGDARTRGMILSAGGRAGAAGSLRRSHVRVAEPLTLTAAAGVTPDPRYRLARRAPAKVLMPRALLGGHARRIRSGSDIPARNIPVTPDNRPQSRRVNLPKGRTRARTGETPMTYPQYPQQPYGQQYPPQSHPYPQQPSQAVQPYTYQPPWLQQHQPPAPPVAPKSTAAGLLLGLLLPGLGCMYAGKVGLGVALLAGWLVSLALVLFVIGWLLAPACWIASGVLGYTTTQAWNRERGIIS